MRVDLPQGTLEYARTGRGRPVVFLHGFGQDHRLWQPLVDELSGEFTCIAPDLPLGAHRAAMAPDADLTFPGQARLVSDLLQALDLTEVTLVGNDTGGATAQVVAARHPERLARLVLTGCETSGNFPPSPFTGLILAARLHAVRPLMAGMRVRALRRLPSAYGWLTTGELPHDLIDDWLDAYRSDAGVRRDARKVLCGFRDRRLLDDVAAELSHFDRPTLLAWPTDDRLFPYEHAHRLTALLPQARLAPVPGSRTWVMRDQPALLAELIRDFVRETSPRSRERVDGGPAGP
ncbi:alpha/beta fold hydrolase [Geodermatophilus sabuli]|uniref:Pimeloyl-ACP methyl ester carboxylesterase n=1 Tax=Geodermatophilus sabuli TaxID=1564158 RepID=A0A285EB84_9ACTN|nr:alpha/beta hydrolase [Geodermatophilus sabuli]MBB3084363.1 pimeloyl-ACP methyl ester carboxylesterase [Geodermatophilus sabuli]SNX96369.1 Pimeloyl-ACP methyl ester carboxylesterase [Geodermatophilus sabuli]